MHRMKWELWSPQSGDVDSRMAEALQQLPWPTQASAELSPERLRTMTAFGRMVLAITRRGQGPRLREDWQDILGMGVLISPVPSGGDRTLQIEKVSVNRLGQLQGAGEAIMDALIDKARRQMAAKVRLDRRENPGVTYQMCRARGFRRVGHDVDELDLSV